MIDLLDLTLLVPPFGVDDGDTPVITDDFLTALRARLKAAAGLETLTDVYLEDAPAGVSMPFLVMSYLFTVKYENSSESWYEVSRYQFDVFSQDMPEVAALGLAAYRGLLWDADDPLLFVEGYEMRRVPEEGGSPRRDPNGMIAGHPVWRYTFECEFMIGRDS